MTDRRLARWMRNAEASPLLESFFIAAVVSFLAIRAFLAVTGYPQPGPSGIHIARLLWGRLLMLAALTLLLPCLDRSVHARGGGHRRAWLRDVRR
jgi:hypothetical protein